MPIWPLNPSQIKSQYLRRRRREVCRCLCCWSGFEPVTKAGRGARPRWSSRLSGEEGVNGSSGPDPWCGRAGKGVCTFALCAPPSMPEPRLFTRQAHAALRRSAKHVGLCRVCGIHFFVSSRLNSHFSSSCSTSLSGREDASDDCTHTR